MKIWIDRKGNVQSFGVGSIEEQYAEMVSILAYLQRQTTAYEQIATRAQAVTPAKAGAANARK